MKEYVTVGTNEVVAETVIEKSRFIACAIRCDTVEQAVEFVNSKRKKYFDATHNCYAYVIGDRAKFSDDGEPQGTAGVPIYECIRNSGLDRVCVVVTRYFGGIKLGAGGLVRAYNGSCAEVLKLCQRVQMTDCLRLEVAVEYSLLKNLRRALAPYAVEENVFYEDKVRLVLLISADSSNTICDIVRENTLGRGEITQIDRLLCPFERRSQ